MQKLYVPIIRICKHDGTIIGPLSNHGRRCIVCLLEKRRKIKYQNNVTT
jgi:hypothetical protein